MLGLSPLELGVIALLIVVLFGAKRLPELGSGVGKAISNFKKGYRESQEIDVTPQKDGNKLDTSAGATGASQSTQASSTQSSSSNKPN